MEGKGGVYLALFLSAFLHFLRDGDAGLQLDFSGGGGIVSPGTNVKFECYSDDQENYSPVFSTGGRIEWRRTRLTAQPSSVEILARWSLGDGSEIVLDNSGNRYSLKGSHDSGGHIRQYFEIRQTSKSDQANYFCAVFNSSGIETKKSRLLKLLIRYPPAEHYPMCTAIPVEVGDDVELKCISEDTTPDVVVQWYKDDSRVSETQQHGYQQRSLYDARPNELGSTFECRLVYVDGDDVEVRRSCKFRRPYVTILETEVDHHVTDRKYHVIVNSSPPLISDITCILELAPNEDMTETVDKEFPGFGVVTVGPVDNGSTLVCRARNVFGWGRDRMIIHTPNVNIPSVHTENPPETELISDIWPKNPLVTPGENLTFVCSYRITVGSVFGTEVRVQWNYNDDPIEESEFHFKEEGNTLLVSFHALHYDENREDSISCVTSVSALKELVPSQKSSTFVRFDPDGHSCSPQLGLSGQTSEGQLMLQSPIIGVYILVGVLILLMSILIVVLRKKNRQPKVCSTQCVSTSQVTFRPDRSSSVGQVNGSGSQAVIQRALPAQPRDSSTTTSTTTLRSVVTTPATTGNPNGTLSKQKPDSVSTIGTSVTELPYQDMVGDTGIVKSRHGSVSSSFHPTYPEEPQLANNPCYHLNHPLPNHHHPPLGRTFSTPSAMVPGPNGGFIPPCLVAGTHGQPSSIQRSMSDNDDAAPRVELENSYEDPDEIRERRRVQRSMSNDYQPAKGTKFDNALKWQKNPFCSVYANSTIGDDSVFITPDPM